MRWLRLHAMLAPFGVFAVTVLLVIRSGQWNGWESLESTASLVDLGAVLYGMIAVLAERGVRMVFWALDERRKWREKRREETRAELLLEQLMSANISAEAKQELERWAQEKGIPLDNPPPR